MADACGKMCCACVAVLTAIRSNNIAILLLVLLLDFINRCINKPMDHSMSDMRTVIIIIINIFFKEVGGG